MSEALTQEQLAQIARHIRQEDRRLPQHSLPHPDSFNGRQLAAQEARRIAARTEMDERNARAQAEVQAAADNARSELKRLARPIAKRNREWADVQREAAELMSRARRLIEDDRKKYAALDADTKRLGGLAAAAPPRTEEN